MAKGVKKITLKEGALFVPDLYNNTIILQPDKPYSFVVSEWHHVPTAADRKSVAWMLQNRERTIILKQWSGSDVLDKFSLTKKECGAYRYYLEAGMNGKNDSGMTGLYIGGGCEPKVISSKWTTQHGGPNIKNEKGIVSYGHVVHLHLETEGLNGNELIIEIYNQAFGNDNLITTYSNALCIEGQVNFKISDTFSWRAKVNNIEEDEEFYVKVKDKGTGKYVKDNHGDDEHAVYLIIKNKVVTTNVQKPQNNTPLKVGQPKVNLERYEPCKFNKIDISEDKKENGKVETITTVVFEHGITKLSDVKHPSEPIRRSVYFNFDKWDIRPDAKATLDNILQFLLEHEHSTIKLDAHADDRGSDEHNMELSQKRADAVKKHFIDGKLDGRRIISVGHGETQLAEKGDHLTEAQHQRNRRSDIAFTFSGHDAGSIIYEVVAPSVSTKKDLVMVIHEFDTKKCLRDKDNHNKKVKVIDVTAALDDKDPEKVYNVSDSGTVVHPVYSDLSEFNAAPIEYIWPTAVKPNEFWYYINTCRYYSNKKNKTVKVKAYPDIKWELAFEFLVNVSNYKAANMPAGSVFAKHQEKAREAGYKRWLMNKQGKVPISMGVNLSAEWDAGKHKRSLSSEFSGKIEALAEVIAKSVDVVQNAINFAQSAAKQTAIPVGFDIRYPKFTVVASWYLERIGNRATVNVVGELGFGFKPLIGAEVVIDIIGAAIAAASYGTTGNPAAARIINNFRKGIEKLGSEKELKN